MSWGNPQNFPEKIMRDALIPASLAYGTGSFLRLAAYATGGLKRARLSRPVMSIGNLTVGGTGKTPITIGIARTLCQAGLNVAIVSRGYKRKSTKPVVVVSDGKGYFASCADAGDEPYLMARSVARAAVVVGADRPAAAQVAIEQFGSDVILLDDGFQHIRLMRDFDLVLIDYNDEPQKDFLLPAGRLREPLSALSRASTIIITKIPYNYDEARLASIKELVRKHAPNAELASSRFVPSKLISLGSDGQPMMTAQGKPVESLKGKKVVAFCGLARPQPFIDQLTELGAVVMRTRVFADHHWYSSKDIALIHNDLYDNKAELILTTEKDLVRLGLSLATDVKIQAVGLDTEWIEGPPRAIQSLIGMASGNKEEVSA